MTVADDSRLKPVPLYLISYLRSVLAQQMFLPAAVEFGRKRAIAGSAQFISAIESYRAAHGRYPVSLASVHHDYDPPTIGVERTPTNLTAGVQRILRATDLPARYAGIRDVQPG